MYDSDDSPFDYKKGLDIYYKDVYGNDYKTIYQLQLERNLSRLTTYIIVIGTKILEKIYYGEDEKSNKIDDKLIK